ncbi:MAG: hypothetical protein QY320_14560 [Gammaproteobacteria bacterium]|nr:MAG: hypothetical protein QY320_14560 [Gammaproteobacteria bacterium]
MQRFSQSRHASLVPVPSLEEFFRDSVEAALASNHVIVERDTSHYVVSLLTLFARSDACYDPTDGGARQRPLALMLAEAVGAGSAEERSFALQRLGDIALFTAGFFAETLRDRTVGVDYYVNMGGGAYRMLAAGGHATVRTRALAEVFAELAAKFLDLVDVLNEVRESARGGDADVLRLYEAWVRTGSRRAARLLRQAGIEPSGQARSDYQH